MKTPTVHEDAQPPAGWPTTSTPTIHDRGVMTAESASRTDPHGRRRAAEHVDAASEDSPPGSRVRKDGPRRAKRLAGVQRLTELPRPGER